MKKLLPALVLLGLAACNTTTQNTGNAAFHAAPSPVTYGSPRSTPASVRSSNVIAAATPAAAPTSHRFAARAPGWYQLPNGLPHAVIHSPSFASTGQPARNFPTLDTAYRHRSGSWNPPYAARLDTVHGHAFARLVTVDESTFLIMKRLRVKEVFKVLFYTREPYENLMSASIQQIGCVREGNTVFRASQGSVHAMAARVTC